MAQVARTGLRSFLSQRLPSLLSPKQAPAAAGKRSFSSSAAQHEDAEEATKWRNLTVAGFVLCTSLGIYNFAGGHEEHQERTEYSYMHIRNKEFPWGPDGLFEYHHEHE